MAKKSIPSQEPPSGSGKWNDTRKAARGAKSSKSVSAQVAEVASSSHEPFRWSASRLDQDVEGEWDWQLASSESAVLLKFLSEMQALTWGEIESHTYNGKKGKRFKKHHAMSVEKLCQAAKERVQICFDGEEIPDEIFRFRLDSVVRLWGRRQRDRFEILWFDRNHRVYPVDD